ncbi:hypothetical protein D9757_014741 [Collybiopsis confluens]|uniref:Uncharacterized protein n=1 Tax=Collybiopsis confluens TaxID=2823264 RepID=A0A8H5FP38_9AGAR|nr:hypothetical protein D9757_014741 [Collybiopsis confluens]
MTPSTYHLVPHLDLFVVGTRLSWKRAGRNQVRPDRVGLRVTRDGGGGGAGGGRGGYGTSEGVRAGAGPATFCSTFD